MTRCAHLGTTTKTTEQWLCWLLMGLWSLEIASCLRVLRALQSAFYSTMRMNKLMPSLFCPKSNYILFTGKHGHNTLVLLSLSQSHILFTGEHGHNTLVLLPLSQDKQYCLLDFSLCVRNVYKNVGGTRSSQMGAFNILSTEGEHTHQLNAPISVHHPTKQRPLFLPLTQNLHDD